MKITKTQLVQIIKEEAANFKKELTLKNELAEIERQLNEVHTTGKLGVKTDTAGHQHDVAFEKVTSSAGVSDTIKEDEEDMDQMEELMAAIKTIAKACGLSGTIELEDETEMGDEEGEEGEEEEEEIETDVIEPGEEEGEEEGEEDEEQGEEIADESEMEEESFTLAKEEATEESADESVEEGKNEEESKTLSEGIEKKRMMQLAGLK
jgi:hypothetical protein